jgi:hypothetical protein
MIKLKKKTESLHKRQGKKKSGPYLKNQNMKNLDWRMQLKKKLTKRSRIKINKSKEWGSIPKYT